MAGTETFQIPLAAAEVYESRFVPGIFAEWAPLIVDAARVAPGQAVLDVACGTGIVARTAADWLLGDGAVIGLDLNTAMLTVARRVRPDLEWQQGDASHLPFPPRTFDVVLCQMALMFFPDRVGALSELARVTTSEGTVAIVVPASIGLQPAYGRLVDIVADEAGADAASLIDAYWSCGDTGDLATWFDAARLRVESIRTHQGTARFDSIDELVATEVEGSPLAARIAEPVYARIKDRARTALRAFEVPGGTVHAPLTCHIGLAHPR